METLKDILDRIEDLVVVLDPDGVIVSFNREAYRVNGMFSPEPLQQGRKFLDTVPEVRKKLVGRILEQVTQHREPIRTFAEYVTSSGATMLLDLNYIPILRDNKLAEIQIIGMDVTAEKAFEKKMRGLVGEVTDIIENANALIFSTDSRGYITHWNKHCTEVLGYDKNEILTQKVDLLVPDDDRHEFAGFFSKALNNELVRNTEISLLRKDRQRLTFTVSATPRVNADNRVTGVTLVGQDITELISYRNSLEKTIEARTFELRQALKKREEALEIKSKFVAIASHEFRTPLTSLQHTARLLKERFTNMNPEELLEKFGYIEHHTTNMLHLLNDVLLYGKSEPGKIKIVAASLDLPSFIHKLVEEVGHSTDHSHNVVLTMESVPTQIITDEKLLRNILINLLTNAIKFSPGKNNVYMEVRGLDNTLQMVVRDEGLGIPDTEIDKIFEPFLRGSHTNEIPGTGLGLSIVKKAVELLQGEISITSELGRGTKATVHLPINIEV